ncbi:MAG TPA: Gldg family protein [Kofleriaceae bacterium]
MIWTTAKKELRGYFNSSIALFFLFSYLLITIFTFFWSEKFFARGMADLRLMFTYTPAVMILLAAALSTRLWAEERRAGTIEILLTLPIPRWKLVVGKFVGGMLLIAIALVLTFGVPLTVAQMGNLDSGPVFGGYLATLLLAAAYLSIALCVSAATDNPIVAFLGTAIVCGLVYAIGWAPDPLGQLGSGVRFESVARGVLDLRDLAYYAAIISIGLALNVLSLARMSWARGPAGAKRRTSLVFSVALVAANAIALVVWLSPVHARIDMTRDGAYSLSPSTEKIVAGLDERVLIRGYFSAKTHPKLAPLIPQIRDMLDEYATIGHGKVKVEIVDPTDSDDAKREAKERFNIEPKAIPFVSQNEKTVVNAYFAIAIEYGDQHQVLELPDLIRVRQLDIGEVEVTLKNLEYEVTRSIKKAVTEFSSVDTLFASSSAPVELTAFITPKTLPENLKDAPAVVQKVVDALTKKANGKFTYKMVEPTTDAQMRDLFQHYGVRPFTDMFGSEPYYFHLLMKVGDRMVRVAPPQDLNEASLKSTIIEGLKRAAPGFTRVVGLWVPPSAGTAPAMQGRPPQQLPPPQTFQTLQQQLGASYEVRDVELTSPIPDDIETLVLAGPVDLDAKAAQNVDQFVMRGGALVVLAGRFRLAMGDGLTVEKVRTGLEDVFTKWGITIGDQMIGDSKNDSFPVPQNKDLGNGMMVREMHQLAYPYFVKFDGNQLGDNLITGGLSGAVLHWPASVKADEKVGDDTHAINTLLRTTGDAWVTTNLKVEPDLAKYPDKGFAPPADTDKKGVQVAAVAISGGFTSAYAKPPAKDDPKKSEHLLAHSPPDARVVVFGSSAFASDDLINLARQLDSPFAEANLELVHNAVDWSLADTDLMAIRSHNAAAHAITMPVDERGKWPWVNAILAAIGLAAVTGFSYLRRRSVRPVVTGGN